MALFGALEQELRLDKSQFSQELSEAEREMESVDDQTQSTGSRFQSMGEKMKGAGMGLTAGVTAPLAAVGFQSLQTASDVEEMQSKMSVVFGDQTDQIKEWAAAQEEATGISELQWQEYATTLQDSFKPMGFAQDEATNMSKEVTSLAADLSSFNNMPMNEAMDRLRGGLVGNHENLERFGVMINQTSLGDQLQEMFGKGIDAATEQEKAQARLQIVMEGTSDAQGDAARTSESWANKMRSLKGQLREAGALIGQQLMPVMKPLLEAAQNAVQRFAGLSTEVKQMVIVAGGLAAALGPVILAFGALLTVVSGPLLAAGAVFATLGGAVFAFRDKLRPLVEALLPRLKQVFNTLIPVIRSAVGQISKQLGPVLRQGFELLQSIVQTYLSTIMAIWNRHGDGVIDVLKILKKVVLATLRGLGAVLLPLIRGMVNQATAFWNKHGEDIKQIVILMADVIAKILRKLGPKVSQALQAIRGFFDKYIKPLLPFARQIFSALASVAGAQFDIMKAAIATAIDAIKTALKVALDIIDGDWSAAWNKIKGFLRRTLDRIISLVKSWDLKGVVKDGVNAAKRAIDNLTDDFKTAGKDLIDAFINGVENKTNAVGNAVDDVVQEARDMLPGSDAKEGPLSDLTASGEALPETVAEGMENNIRALEGSSTKVAHAANPAMAGGSARRGGSTHIEIYVDGSKAPEQTARAVEQKLRQAGVNSWRS